MTNPWTDQMLADDYHLGNRGEAQKIIRENAGHDVHDCLCGGKAHYKNTIGAHKCTACGALRFSNGTWSD